MIETQNRLPDKPVDEAIAGLVSDGLIESAGTCDGVFVVDRATLTAEIDRRLAAGGEVAVTSIAVRNLAIANEVYGFEAGDLLQRAVLAATAAVLAGQDPASRVASLAGAQLAVLHDSADAEVVETVVERLQRALDRLVVRQPQRLLSAKVRLVCLTASPVDGEGGDELLRTACYAHLGTARGPVYLRGEREPVRHLALAREREARADQIAGVLRAGAVEVRFQPVVDLATRALYDVEALARIRGEQGLIEAADFIDTVYHLGEITAVDCQVLTRVRERAHELAAVSPRLFLNVSPISLASGEFRNLMTATVEQMQGQGIGLVVVLELTEQAIVEHLDIIREIHREHHVRFAVDDFGTGYSSLKTVSDLAIAGVISYLKLDGSLIRQLETSREAYKVVLAISNLAQSLDLKVVAEHVETEAVLDRLRSCGVPLGQGRLFDMPLDLDELVVRYGNARRRRAEPSFSDAQLAVLEPYVDRAMQAFYDTLLSSGHFAGFFRDADQVRSLMGRQRDNFLAGLREDEDALQRRYVHLGRLHSELGIPFPTYMAGTDILAHELLTVLGHVAEDGDMIRRCQDYFVRIKSAMARGYLDDVLAREWDELDQALAAAHRGVRRLGADGVDWLRRLLAALPNPPAAEGPARPTTADLAEIGRRSIAAADALRNLDADAASLEYFLESGDYTSAMLMYRQISGHLMRLAAVVPS